MLKSIRVHGFKSLVDVEAVELAPLTVLFGPNTAGKSNFLEAIQLLSRLATERTVAEALQGSARGDPVEMFTFPSAGLPGLLKEDSAQFTVEARVAHKGLEYVYRASPAIRPQSGVLFVLDEYLAALNRDGSPKGEPRTERQGDKQVVRRARRGHPHEDPADRAFTQLSNPRLSGQGYEAFDAVRAELATWKTYYLDPRVSMRAPQRPRAVDDIGALGEHLAAFLYRLKAEAPKAFASVGRVMRTVVPGVEDVTVGIDEKRGVIDVSVVQNGTPFSTSLVSEGTLRVLALVCLAVSPWGGGLLAFEEPENGVHPRRIELIAQMLLSMATAPTRAHQVVVTTHSPVLCGEMVRLAREKPNLVRLYNVARSEEGTDLRLFDPSLPLLADEEVRKGLGSPSEDQAFTWLMLRGLLDG